MPTNLPMCLLTCLLIILASPYRFVCINCLCLYTFLSICSLSIYKIQKKILRNLMSFWEQNWRKQDKDRKEKGKERRMRKQSNEVIKLKRESIDVSDMWQSIVFSELMVPMSAGIDVTLSVISVKCYWCGSPLLGSDICVQWFQSFLTVTVTVTGVEGCFPLLFRMFFFSYSFF